MMVFKSLKVLKVLFVTTIAAYAFVCIASRMESSPDEHHVASNKSNFINIEASNYLGDDDSIANKRFRSSSREIGEKGRLDTKDTIVGLRNLFRVDSSTKPNNIVIASNESLDRNKEMNVDHHSIDELHQTQQSGEMRNVFNEVEDRFQISTEGGDFKMKWITNDSFMKSTKDSKKEVSCTI